MLYVVQILCRVKRRYTLLSDGKTQILVKKDLWTTVSCTYHLALSRLLYYTLWFKQVYMFLLTEKSELRFEWKKAFLEDVKPTARVTDK